MAEVPLNDVEQGGLAGARPPASTTSLDASEHDVRVAARATSDLTDDLCALHPMLPARIICISCRIEARIRDDESSSWM